MWQGAGRWTTDEDAGGLRYAGYTHDDPVLRALLDLAPRLEPGPQRDALEGLFAERCAKCHLDPALPPSERLQWDALPARPETTRRLTHFAHEPHLALESDCTTCHQLPDLQPARSDSDFVIPETWRTRGGPQPDGTVTGCLQCHTETKYGASCQTCHDYHSGELTPRVGGAPRRLLGK